MMEKVMFEKKRNKRGRKREVKIIIEKDRESIEEMDRIGNEKRRIVNVVESRRVGNEIEKSRIEKLRRKLKGKKKKRKKKRKKIGNEMMMWNGKWSIGLKRKKKIKKFMEGWGLFK